jgi:hypothetical protein
MMLMRLDAFAAIVAVLCGYRASRERLRSRPRPIAGRISRRICSSVEPMTLWVADIYDPSKT